MKKTALYDSHLNLKARMIPFAGFLLPVQYEEGIRKEHNRVRNHVGIFDVSHMGQIRIKGQKAADHLQWVTCNNVSKLDTGKAQYSLLTNFKGGIVDDVIIYCIEKDKDYLICVNAINKDKDLEWIQEHQRGNLREDVQVSDESDDWSLIAIQGPKALQLASLIFGENILSLNSFDCIFCRDCWIARTGYTGEEGVEVFVPVEQVCDLWQRLLDEGQDLQVGAIGLGARDSLRIEMKYPLYGHEIDEDINPIESGLGWVVKFKKGDFIGRDAIWKVKEMGISRKLVGLKMLEGGGIPRQGYKIQNDEKVEIGDITSGILSPTLGVPIGIGYVSNQFASISHQVRVVIRQHLVKAEVVKTPFIVKNKS